MSEYNYCENCQYAEQRRFNVYPCTWCQRAMLDQFRLVSGKEPPKPSNADRIRGMSDEELAKFIKHLDSGLDEICDIQDISQDGNGCDRHENCYACYLDWLKQPAETEGTE